MVKKIVLVILTLIVTVLCVCALYKFRMDRFPRSAINGLQGPTTILQQQHHHQQKNQQYHHHHHFHHYPNLGQLHRGPREAPHQMMNKTQLYRYCLGFTRRLLAHLRRAPSSMSLLDLKPHLWILFRRLNFYPFVSQYLEAHVGSVTTANDALPLYNLLDLYSALELTHHAHLQQVKKRFLDMEKEGSAAQGKVVNNLGNMITGFNIHIKQIKNNMTLLYSRPQVSIAAVCQQYQLCGVL
ncbi:uncharacterized protein LOC121858119 isoform X2 [Homarus americanus]|uniref:uncharacterized protein LOC121858119 isoform X2 n=1 Tax=Homarus americanus TaxID=6706 RepID=UPI001C4900D4|nr:uncharacterized protein LOC121858119 isoform X2 [Homarus americanus]